MLVADEDRPYSAGIASVEDPVSSCTLTVRRVEATGVEYDEYVALRGRQTAAEADRRRRLAREDGACEEMWDDLCPYEVKRRETMAENEAFLRQLDQDEMGDGAEA